MNETGEACWKIKYSQAEAARLASDKKMISLGHKRSYHCPLCGYYHLTSKDLKENP